MIVNIYDTYLFSFDPKLAKKQCLTRIFYTGVNRTHREANRG